MPTLILRSLDCDRRDELSDHVRLEVKRDGESTSKFELDITTRQRQELSIELPFVNDAVIRLKILGAVAQAVELREVGGPAIIVLDQLPQVIGDQRGLHRGKHEFKRTIAGPAEDVKYVLWLEVIPDGWTAEEFHRRAIPTRISLRRLLGRLGRGVLSESDYEKVKATRYRCAEVLSLRDLMAEHNGQDGAKSTTSIRHWIARHCNLWSEETVIPLSSLPQAVRPPADLLASTPQWTAVQGEVSIRYEGIQLERSGMSGTDLFTTHASRDWVFDVLPSPPFSYLLAYTAKTQSANFIPKVHCEWESGSMPEEWRPQRGEYVTLIGRFVFDRGHLPMATEIHAPHTIVRERTVLVGNEPVNEAVVGMGLSGGFPANTFDETQVRWNAELPGLFPGMVPENSRCYPTNLKRHPLRTKLFPPNPRPGPDYRLRAQVVAGSKQAIHVRESRLEDFMRACRRNLANDTEPVNRSFADWFPDGLVSGAAVPDPRLVNRGRHLEMEVDLSGMGGIPVAYLVVVRCWWERGG